MKKYFSFLGTASRSEFWAVYLINIAAFIASLMAGLMFLGVGENMDSAMPMLLGTLILIGAIVGTVWVSIATTVRRCKDADINPWWTLTTLIPYLSFITVIVIGVLPTADKNNN
jgi:uncharacterized membrane protein YhaH (DUF805 family)